MATYAGADDEQVVVERFQGVSIFRERSRDLLGAAEESVRIGCVFERSETQGLASEAAESEIDRLRGSEECVVAVVVLV